MKSWLRSLSTVVFVSLISVALLYCGDDSEPGHQDLSSRRHVVTAQKCGANGWVVKCINGNVEFHNSTDLRMGLEPCMPPLMIIERRTLFAPTQGENAGCFLSSGRALLATHVSPSGEFLEGEEATHLPTKRYVEVRLPNLRRYGRCPTAGFINTDDVRFEFVDGTELPPDGAYPVDSTRYRGNSSDLDSHIPQRYLDICETGNAYLNSCLDGPTILAGWRGPATRLSSPLYSRPNRHPSILRVSEETPTIVDWHSRPRPIPTTRCRTTENHAVQRAQQRLDRLDSSRPLFLPRTSAGTGKHDMVVAFEFSDVRYTEHLKLSLETPEGTITIPKEGLTWGGSGAYAFQYQGQMRGAWILHIDTGIPNNGVLLQWAIRELTHK